MNYKRLELVMSVLLIVAVLIASTLGLAQGKSGVIITQAENESQDKTKLVVLDSGHGGIDGGKESSAGILEKDINLKIAYYLKDLLENAGIKVVMTRTDDNGLYSESDSNKKVADMKKRCQIISQSNADIVISIHQNSFSDPKVSGAQVFYYKHSADGKKLAGIIQNSFKEHLNSSNTRVEKSNDTYYMLINTTCPTVIAECGFLSNPDEAELLNSDEYQQRVALALYNGIEKYFGQ